MPENDSDSTGQVGPIIFSNPDAREQLMEREEVYTFRTSDRTTGETWACKTRLGSKIADVTVEQVKSISELGPEPLEKWADKSGFGTAEAWFEAILDVHGHPDSGYVYRVTKGHKQS